MFYDHPYNPEDSEKGAVLVVRYRDIYGNQFETRCEGKAPGYRPVIEN